MQHFATLADIRKSFVAFTLPLPDVRSCDLRVVPAKEMGPNQVNQSDSLTVWCT